MKKLASMVIVMSLFASTSAFAQVRRDQAEKATDRQELRQDKHQTRDDRLDLAELQTLLRDFDKARARRNMARLDRIDVDLRNVLRAELAEGRNEQAQKNAEAGRSTGEVVSDQRELHRDAATGAPPRVAADDVRDRRDDRADAADDRKDAAIEADQQARRRAIARELSPLFGRKDPRALDRKRELMVQLIDVARAEAFQDMRERKEDKKELQEDRKETREDRRQRN